MNYVVIDVREPEEYQSGHTNGSLNIPLAELMKGASQLSDVPKDSKIIVYCRTGNRSNVAMRILNSLGYPNVTNGINKEQVAANFGMQ
jgi:rhodanese-related sulfurtransferase